VDDSSRASALGLSGALDLVPSFIDHARRAHPEVSFAIGDLVLGTFSF